MKNHILTKPIQFMLGPDGDEGGGEDVIPESKDFKDFAARFSAKGRAPLDQGGDPDNKPTQDDIANRVADERRQAEERAAQKQQSQETAKKTEGQRKQPFVPRLIEEKRTVEHERDELKTKVSEYEEKLTKTETQISELQKKIDSGDFSTAKEKEFQDKIVQLETRAKEQTDSLVNENAKLQSRLEFHDLAESPRFQKEYLQPVIAAHNDAMEILGDDNKKKEIFHSALIANSAALSAQTIEARQRAQSERDAILGSIVEGMNQYSAGRFTNAVNEYLRATLKHAAALGDHEKTAATIRAEMKEEHTKQYSERLQTWDKTYRSGLERYKDMEAITDEEKATAKELGIDVDAEFRRADLIASKSVVGETDMNEALELIHRGRIHPILNARIKVLEKSIKDRDAVIKKLRGGGTGDANPDQREGKKEEKETREEWQARKFGASRMVETA